MSRPLPLPNHHGSSCELGRAFRDSSDNKVFSQTLLKGLGPDGTIKLTNELNELAYDDDQKNPDAATAFFHPAGNGPGSDHVGNDHLKYLLNEREWPQHSTRPRPRPSVREPESLLRRIPGHQQGCTGYVLPGPGLPLLVLGLTTLTAGLATLTTTRRNRTSSPDYDRNRELT
ncbi:hypothetical protein ACF05L_28690 [Streptomyces bobili]|uniref:hypothetical protein n=1 Tax=Streptomyces bobili TaxID=67280 RepID=UPI003700C66E